MEAVCNYRSDDVSREPSTTYGMQASQTRVAAVSGSRSLDVNLMTREGDKVTLSMDAKASAIYACHGAAGMDENGMDARWGEFASGRFERDMTLTVEGDLNGQERREIRKVIGAINRMMHGFVQGKLSPMMAKAEKLAGLETIDSLDVEISYQNRVLVAQHSQDAVLYDRTGEVTPPGAGTGNRAGETPMSLQARAVAEDMAETIHTSGAPMDPMRAMADRMLQAYRDQVSQWHPLGGHIMDHIREIFESAMEAFGRGEDHAHDQARSLGDWD
jgi:hypothetical protein